MSTNYLTLESKSRKKSSHSQEKHSQRKPPSQSMLKAAAAKTVVVGQTHSSRSRAKAKSSIYGDQALQTSSLGPDICQAKDKNSNLSLTRER